MYYLTNILLAFLAIFTITFIFRMRCKNECDRALCKANIESLDRNFASDMTIVNLLDNFISKQFSVIISENIEYSKLDYVKDRDVKDIQKDLANDVASKISPAFINTLTLIYNKESLGNIISKRCYMIVIEWAREKNKLANETNNQINIMK